MRLRTPFGPLCIVVGLLLCSFSAPTDLRGQSTGEWIGQLGDANSKNRVAAAKALGALGGTLENKKVVPVLIATFKKEKDNEVRVALLGALGKMGPAASEVVPDLIEALAVDELRYQAVAALGQMGVAAKSAVPQLAALLKDPDLGQVAARALGSMSLAAVATLTEACGSKDVVVRSRAAYALGEVGSRMAEEVGGGSPQIAGAIATLVTGLGDESSDVRYWATFALGELGVKDASVISAVVERLDDKDQAVRNQAGRALGKMGGEAVPSLVQALKHEQVRVRRGAARALGEIRGEAAEGAAPDLVTLLKDGDVQVRYETVLALKSIGKDAGVVAVGLVAALKDADGTVRNQSAHALVALGAASVNPLIPALKDDAVRYPALRALRKIGSGAKPAIAAVTETLNDTDEKVRYESVRILESFGEEAKAAIPELEKLLTDSSERVRDAAKAALEVVKVEPEKKE